ncbi:hypothetical protein [Aeoliella sp.]|uniref:hypothetical protein n=1 Tax=Aeoliella sp. TaxID=2795800 RepID=UPI003CCB9DB4
MSPLALGLAFAIAWTFSSLSPAATLHTDDFESGMMDWTSGAQITRPEDGGPTGAGDAHLLVSTTFHLATHNSASDWTGDLAAINATRVMADLMVPVGESPLEMRLVLFASGNVRTAARWVSTTANNVPADGVWRTYEFSLAEDALARQLGSGTYTELMGGVQRVMLRHGAAQAGGEFVQGSLGIDNVTLASTPQVLAGDYNDDGLVNLADYTLWRNNLGAATGTLENDIDGGTIGAAQYLTWKAEFGNDAPGLAASQIPEPSGVLWCVAGGMMLLCGATRRYQHATQLDS